VDHKTKKSGLIVLPINMTEL